METGTAKYGKYYWCVKTNLSKDGEIYLMADWTEVTANGDLLFWRSGGLLNMSIAAGSWKAFFAASLIDGSAVAVEHWKGEIAGNDEDGEASVEERILRTVTQNGPLTIREITQRVNAVDRKRARPIIDKLVASGDLIEVESGRTCRYALPE